MAIIYEIEYCINDNNFIYLNRIIVLWHGVSNKTIKQTHIIVRSSFYY